MRLHAQIPRVELVEMGPALDLALRRHRAAAPDLEKEALKQPKLTKKKARRPPVAIAFLGLTCSALRQVPSFLVPLQMLHPPVLVLGDLCAAPPKTYDRPWQEYSNARLGSESPVLGMYGLGAFVVLPSQRMVACAVMSA